MILLLIGSLAHSGGKFGSCLAHDDFVVSNNGASSKPGAVHPAEMFAAQVEAFQMRLPVVLIRQEVTSAFSHLEGVHLLVTKLLYGTGMRIMEAPRLRTKDIDFDHNCIIIRCSKGDKAGPLDSLSNRTIATAGQC